MPTGGLHPGPERTGGRKPTLKYIIESIGAQLGSAYDTSTSSNVYPQLLAFSRAIAEAWSTNQRMANQWDAKRMTDFLPRWEAILGITPKPTDTEVARRARVELRMSRIGQEANFQGVNDTLTQLLGTSIYLGITITTSASANIWTPSTWPMGSHDPTGAILWYSTIANLAIHVAKPAVMPEGEFYELLGSITPVLDSFLPAWITFDWYRTDIHPGSGFYLDELNLDNEAFDV